MGRDTVYKGNRTSECGAQTVLKREYDTAPWEPLYPEPSQKLWNHSPTGFNWGYSGSGPAQLALAILLDVTGDADLAVSLHQDFKAAKVAGWGEEWEISAEEVMRWVRSKSAAGVS